MLSEDGKNVVAQEKSDSESEQESVVEEGPSPICSVDTAKRVSNFIFIVSMLFLMIVAIRTFDVCVQKSVSKELSDEEITSFVIETIFNRLCFTLGPILLLLTVVKRFSETLEEGEAKRNKNSTDADE